VEVLDTGIGIPEEQREAVFEKFVQAHSGRRHSGSGLGLAIARKLIQIMGGAIGIESGEEGCGTLVWFTLPLASEAAVLSQPPGGQIVSPQARP
jgi:signal transduction histidine kinase